MQGAAMLFSIAALALCTFTPPKPLCKLTFLVNFACFLC